MEPGRSGAVCHNPKLCRLCQHHECRRHHRCQREVRLRNWPHRQPDRRDSEGRIKLVSEFWMTWLERTCCDPQRLIEHSDSRMNRNADNMAEECMTLTKVLNSIETATSFLSVQLTNRCLASESASTAKSDCFLLLLGRSQSPLHYVNTGHWPNCQNRTGS